MQIIKRAPGDTYTLTKFFQFKSKLKDSDSFYFWSLHFNPFAVEKVNLEFIRKYLPNYSEDQINYYTNTSFINRDWVAEIYQKISYDKSFEPVANLYRDILIENITTPTVLLGIKDHLTPSQFDPWIEKRPWLINPLLDIFKHHNNKKFILLTSVENLDLYIKEKNVKIISWGGDISNHLQQYKKIDPVIDKNFDSKQSYLSLNRHNRHHRIHLVSLLLELGLENYGLISCMFKTVLDSSVNNCNWKYPNESVEKIFLDGFLKIKNFDFNINDHYEIYGKVRNDNVKNFTNSLSKYYKQTFIEFVSETNYTEKCFNITEKTANSILGCCFPIWISSKGTVEFLRSTGLDVFDDVIDHTYDTIDDPADRLYHAVVDNIELLTDIEKTKSLWKQNQSRFLRNVEYFRNDLWQFYDRRLNGELSKIPQFLSNGSESLDNGRGHRTP